MKDIINKYIIIIYIDNQGPYLKIIDVETNERYFSYVYNNISNGTIYKIGLVAVNDKGEMSDLNIKEFRSSMTDGNVEKYSHKFNSQILCDPGGQHRIVDKCQNDKLNIIAAINYQMKKHFILTKKSIILMDSLNKKTIFDFKI